MKFATKICLWLLAFVPIAFDTNVFFPHASIKAFYIQTWLVLAGVFLLIEIVKSRNFRSDVADKLQQHLKNPLFLSVAAFTGVLIINTIFAVDKSLAFWGNLNRVEGLTMMIFLFAFLLFSGLVFEKKDWRIFFHLTLLATIILLAKQYTEYFAEGIMRPGSYTGNPTFLAGYLLFSITAGILILDETKNWFLKSYVFLIMLASVAGILLTQTRGTLLGLILGGLVCLVYASIKGGSVGIGKAHKADKGSTGASKVSLQKISIVLLIIGIAFSATFVVTRKSAVWQNVPGLARLAETNRGDENDPSTAIRLYVYRSSIDALRPSQNGYKKHLFGWGLENYGLANAEYYFAKQYRYEQRWYDRAHNKFLDTLVMSGVVGLLAYLAVLFFAFKFLVKKSFKRENFSIEILAIYFFMVAYITHLMFVFDQVSTFIPFYAILAFIIYLSPPNLSNNQPEHQAGRKTSHQNGRENARGRARNTETLAIVTVSALTLFLCFVYVADTFPGYLQMRQYKFLIEQPISSDFEIKIEKIISPNTVAQMSVILNFLEISNKMHAKDPTPENFKILELAIEKAENFVNRRPLEIRFKPTLADLYTRKGNAIKNEDYIKRGEVLLHEILKHAPNRPDIKYILALNLLVQKREMEAFILFESIFDDQEIILEVDRQNFQSTYTALVKYFYDERDLENLIKVGDRLRENNFDGIASLDAILDYVLESGEWPIVDFR